jgi:hypothetical protein
MRKTDIEQGMGGAWAAVANVLRQFAVGKVASGEVYVSCEGESPPYYWTKVQLF